MTRNSVQYQEKDGAMDSKGGDDNDDKDDDANKQLSMSTSIEGIPYEFASSIQILAKKKHF